MISNSTITNTTFDEDVVQLNVQNATIERCKFQKLVNNASISGSLNKCQFEGLSEGIVINGPLIDMTIQVDITPSSAHYVQNTEVLSQLVAIQQLSIDPQVVPRLAETLHKECFVNIVKPNDQDTFIVQLATDDTNPSGIILMFYPGQITPPKTLADVIPKGYALCDGELHGGIRTPDLRGKFIRGAENESDIGDHQNPDLVQNNGTGRYSYIQIHDYNLPLHTHVLTLTADIDISGLYTDTRGSEERNGFTYISHYSTARVNEGEGSLTSAGDSISTDTGYITVNWEHSHDVLGTASLTNINITHNTAQENYENRLINIEPNSYALVFIMKL